MDPNVPAQTILTFLMICQDPDLTVVQLAERLGVSQSSASRNVAFLTDMHRLKKPGLGLVEKRINPLNERTKVLSLTPRGRRMLQTLEDLMA